MRPIRLTLVAILLPAAACGGERGAAVPTVRDSAGITIVENAGTVWAEGRGWTVADTPTVSIGGLEGEAAADMSGIIGVVRLSDDRLAVANGAGPDIRFFDPAGAHLRTSGRKGSGPGEFQTLAGLFGFDGDSLLAADMLTRRMAVLAPDGSAAREFTLGGAGGMQVGEQSVSLAIPVGAFPDGSVLGMAQAFRINQAPAGAYRDTAAYVVFGPDGAVRDTAIRMPGIEMEQVTMNFMGREFTAPQPVPLGRITTLAVRSGTIAAARNDRYEIEVHSADGALVRLVRVAMAPRPVTDADQAAHRKEQLNVLANAPGMGAVPEPLKQQLRARIEQVKYPATYPYVQEMRYDPDGNLWVGEVQPAGTTVRVYAVFDTTGALL
ncbi:MAG TPA: hypothetical protein VLL51_03480, partial [Gemmatimonadales bacterium]|nr:hypothetical protein [Gemmatimonadales bacterium]